MFINIIPFLTITTFILLFYIIFLEKTQIKESRTENLFERLQAYYTNFNLRNISYTFYSLMFFSVASKMLIFITETVSNEITNYKNLAYIIIWKITKKANILLVTILLTKFIFFIKIYWYYKDNGISEMNGNTFIEEYHRHSYYSKPWLAIVIFSTIVTDFFVVTYEVGKKIKMVYNGVDLPEIDSISKSFYTSMIIFGLIFILLLSIYIYGYFILLEKARHLFGIDVSIPLMISILFPILYLILILLYEKRYLRILERDFNISYPVE